MESKKLKDEMVAAVDTFNATCRSLIEKYAVVAPVGRGDTAATARSRRRQSLITEQTLALAILIGKHPEGVRAATLVKESGIEKNRISVPLKKAATLHLTRMLGIKGGAFYLPV